jgi:hypothetical protein
MEGGQCHSTSVNYALILSMVVLCSQYSICHWHCREEVNLALVTCIMVCSNVQFCYCFVIGEKRYH